MSTPSFFVAGATGYTGRALVPHAVAAGASVVAHIRPGSSRLAECGPVFQDAGATLDTHPWQLDGMVSALQNAQPTHVFALIGTSGPRRREARAAGGRDSFQSVDRDLALMLLQAAESLGAAPRFIYLSAVGADRPAGAYMKARAAVEQALRDSPVPYTIARPSFITGADRPDGRPGERVGATVADAALGALAAVGLRKPLDRFGSMTGGQLARALVAAALDPSLAGALLEPPALRDLAGRG